MNSFRISFNNVLKELLFSQIHLHPHSLYKITEGIRSNYYYTDDCEQTTMISLESTDFGYETRLVDLPFLLQPFIQFQVFHDIVYLDIPGWETDEWGGSGFYECNVQDRYYEWYDEYVDYLEDIPSAPPLLIPAKIVLKTYIVSCDKHSQKKQCMICLSERRRFSVCIQCDKEICVKCMLILQKELVSKNIEKVCYAISIGGVRCPYCRNEYPSLTKLDLIDFE